MALLGSLIGINRLINISRSVPQPRNQGASRNPQPTLFISGLFGKDTVSARLQNHWINLDFILVTSIDIIKEVNRVFHYSRIQQRFNPKEETLKRFFRLIFRKAIITKDRYKTDRITDDPTDNKFLACALEGKADYIVLRDPHLRNLKHYHGIQIVDASMFVSKIADE